MTHWYIAECEACVIKLPFRSFSERKEWAEEHSTINEDHECKLSEVE